MKKMLRFDAIRTRADPSFFLFWLAFLAAFALYAFTLHLGRLGGTGNTAMPLNVSYSAYAAKDAWVALCLLVSAMAARSVRSDISSRRIEVILTQRVDRREYYLGRSLFFVLTGVLLTLALVAIAWSVGNVVFMGRYPVSSLDAEVGSGAALGLLCSGAALASISLLPVVGAAVGLALLKAPAAAVYAVLAFLAWPLSVVANALFGPAIMVDYAFAEVPRLGAGSAVVVLAVLAATALVYPVLWSLVMKRDI